MSSTIGGGVTSAADDADDDAYAGGHGEMGTGVSLLGVAGVGVTAPSGHPPSIERALRVDGETVLGESGPVARLIGGDAGLLGTVSFRFGFMRRPLRGPDCVAGDGVAGVGVGGERKPAGVSGDGASRCDGDGFVVALLGVCMVGRRHARRCW